MHYKVRGGSRQHFELFNDQNDLLGSLDYPAWWPKKAQITIVDSLTYCITPTGFWQTTMVVTKNDMPFAEIKPFPGRGFRLLFATEAQPYNFRKKVFWNTDYALFDEQGHEIAFVQVDFKWKTWSFHYEINIPPNMLDKETNAVLPLLLVYCVGYARMRHAVV